MKLNEKQWKYTLPTDLALKLRKSIKSEDCEGIKEALKGCYQDLAKNAIIDEDDSDTYISDLDFIDDTDYDWMDEFDYILEDFWDLCDNLEVWVPLRESKNRVKTEDYDERDTLEAELVLETVNELWNDAETFSGARRQDNELNAETEKLLDTLDSYYAFMKKRYKVNDILIGENKKRIKNEEKTVSSSDKQESNSSGDVNWLISELNDIHKFLRDLDIFDNTLNEKTNKFLSALVEYTEYLSDYAD